MASDFDKSKWSQLTKELVIPPFRGRQISSDDSGTPKGLSRAVKSLSLGSGSTIALRSQRADSVSGSCAVAPALHDVAEVDVSSAGDTMPPLIKRRSSAKMQQTCTSTPPTSPASGNERLVSYVIPASFFTEASKACHVGPSVCRRTLSSNTDETVSLPWRQLLSSPLVSFLISGNEGQAWIQLSGHKDNFVPGTGGTILKKASPMERQAYELLMEPSEPIRHFVPLFFKGSEIDGEQYIEMEDLLNHFTNPCCMDIKMGVRTFLESEVSKTKLRKDLLTKMIKIDPDEPTAQERENGITKLRYMTFREMRSTSKSLGFRVEGVRLAGEPPRSSFQNIATREAAKDVVSSFLPSVESDIHSQVVNGFIAALTDLREALEMSTFFKNHEIIGSSLLFLYDKSGTAGVWMIDFGKTSEIETPLSHNIPWVLGNHEDGYMIGLHSIFDILTEFL